MARDQIEYCGNCPHYAKCLAHAKEGRLKACKINTEKKGA